LVDSESTGSLVSDNDDTDEEDDDDDDLGELAVGC